MVGWWWGWWGWVKVGWRGTPRVQLATISGFITVGNVDFDLLSANTTLLKIFDARLPKGVANPRHSARCAIQVGKTPE